MRRDVLELRQFYASDLGSAARAMVARKLTEAWGQQVTVENRGGAGGQAPLGP